VRRPGRRVFGKCKRTSTLILFLSSVLLADVLLAEQPLAFGVKAGGRVTGDLDSFFAISESRHYAVGPMVTVALPSGFRIEVDGLYRRVGYRTSDTDPVGGVYTERQIGNSWEFPMLLRKRIGYGLYAAAGYAPRVIHGSGHVNIIQTVDLIHNTKSFFQTDVPGSWQTTHGIVAAAGIEKRFGRMRLAPEVRYIFWTGPSVDVQGSRGFSISGSQHQMDLLVGITFP
jgi:hypothetical protein